MDFVQIFSRVFFAPWGLRFCEYVDRDIQEDVSVRNSGSAQSWVMCDSDQYTIGDNQGIGALWGYMRRNWNCEHRKISLLQYDDEGTNESSKHKTNERAYVKGILVQYCGDNGIGLFGIDLKASSATHLTQMNTRYPEMLIRFQEFLPAWYGLTSKSSSMQLLTEKHWRLAMGWINSLFPILFWSITQKYRWL